MFEVSSTRYGLLAKVRGKLTRVDALQLNRELRKVLEEVRKPFGAVIDARAFDPTGPDTEAIWLSNTQLLDEAGRERTAAIVNKATTKVQMDRHVRENGRGRSHRILLCCHEDWESCSCVGTAEAWVTNGAEPPEVDTSEE